ncbi:MAG: hypothetical protein EOO83_01185 [Oxalobacteraceae bacterium]|nr:MAG: hypothetical protein EOO83_01185 [Oxalobacteraceae bacterium]
MFDGRTGALLGSYVVTANGAELTLAHASGDSTIVKMHAGRLADQCIVDWSTAGYELYCASLPPHGQETEEQEFARQDWENERFGSRIAYGLALRDTAELRQDVGAPSHAAAL